MDDDAGSQVLWKCPRVDAVGEDAPHRVYVVGFSVGHHDERGSLRQALPDPFEEGAYGQGVLLAEGPEHVSSRLPHEDGDPAPVEAVQEEDHEVALQAGCGEVEAGGEGSDGGLDEGPGHPEQLCDILLRDPRGDELAHPDGVEGEEYAGLEGSPHAHASVPRAEEHGGSPVGSPAVHGLPAVGAVEEQVGLLPPPLQAGAHRAVLGLHQEDEVEADRPERLERFKNRAHQE